MPTPNETPETPDPAVLQATLAAAQEKLAEVEKALKVKTSTLAKIETAFQKLTTHDADLAKQFKAVARGEATEFAKAAPATTPTDDYVSPEQAQIKELREQLSKLTATIETRFEDLGNTAKSLKTNATWESLRKTLGDEDFEALKPEALKRAKDFGFESAEDIENPKILALLFDAAKGKRDGYDAAQNEFAARKTARENLRAPAPRSLGAEIQEPKEFSGIEDGIAQMIGQMRR